MSKQESRDEDQDRKDGVARAVMDVPMRVEIVIGRARMPLSSLMRLAKGAVIELDRRVGDNVDIVLNDRVIGRGELVETGDDGVGVKLTEITAPGR